MSVPGVDLYEADLHGADLRDADLDFSAWPFFCGSFGVKVDDRLIAQLFCHWARLDVSGCSPWVRYVHRYTCALFKGYMTNLFCIYRSGITEIATGGNPKGGD